MKSLLILGAGGFGHMIKETAQALGYEEIVFLDDMVKEDDVIGMCCDSGARLFYHAEIGSEYEYKD